MSIRDRKNMGHMKFSNTYLAHVPNMYLKICAKNYTCGSADVLKEKNFRREKA